MDQNTKQDVKSTSLEAVIVRCGCTAEQRYRALWHGYNNQPCPNPLRTENLGRIAFWHKNPFKLLAWRIGQWLRGRRAGNAAAT
jgi:hypothetical protein